MKRSVSVRYHQVVCSVQTRQFHQNWPRRKAAGGSFKFRRKDTPCQRWPGAGFPLWLLTRPPWLAVRKEAGTTWNNDTEVWVRGGFNIQLCVFTRWEMSPFTLSTSPSDIRLVEGGVRTWTGTVSLGPSGAPGQMLQLGVGCQSRAEVRQLPWLLNKKTSAGVFWHFRANSPAWIKGFLETGLWLKLGLTFLHGMFLNLCFYFFFLP